MSPIDPRELGHGLTPTGTFEEGYRCVRCDYDLTGLSQGTVCPECGTPNSRITYEKKRGTGVSRAPIAYVSRLSTWLWAAAFALIATWFTGALAGIMPHPVTFGIRFIAAMAWMGTVWLATKPKPDRFEPGANDIFDNQRLRLAAILGQGLWLVVILLDVVEWIVSLNPNFSPGVGSALGFVSGLMGLLAAAGFVPLGIMLASLANWMGDAEAEGRCQAASWLIAFHGVGVLLASLINFIGILFVVFWIAYLVGVVMLAMSLFALAKAANWAVQNTRHKSQISGRRAVIERQRSIAAEIQLQDRLDSIDARDPSVQAGRKAPPKGIPVPKSHIIDRRDDTSPYRVDEA